MGAALSPAEPLDEVFDRTRPKRPTADALWSKRCGKQMRGQNCAVVKTATGPDGPTRARSSRHRCSRGCDDPRPFSFVEALLRRCLQRLGAVGGTSIRILSESARVLSGSSLRIPSFSGAAAQGFAVLLPAAAASAAAAKKASTRTLIHRP